MSANKRLLMLNKRISSQLSKKIKCPCVVYGLGYGLGYGFIFFRFHI